jgi:large subunit ribosomal protein L10
MTAGEPSGATGAVQLTTKGRPVPKAKLNQVAEIVSLLDKYDYVSLVRAEQIGSKQLQTIKKALRPQALIHMARNTIMTRAIQLAAQKKKKLERLLPFMTGSCALAFTNITPFALNDLLQKNKAKAPAKEGSMSPKDLVVAAGNTGFPPGPMITDLSQVGLKTRVQGGSIWITEDCVVVKAGQTVTRMQALVLSRLGQQPYEIWLKILAAYDQGTILSSDIFLLTVSEILNQLQGASQSSLGLALTINYITPETAPLMLQRAQSQARALALKAGFPLEGSAPAAVPGAEQPAAAPAEGAGEKKPAAPPKKSRQAKSKD